MGQISLKSHIPFKRYGLLFVIFSATPYESFSWNRTALQKDRWMEVFEFRVVSCERMENKLVCEKDLKHFHTSLLGNEEDAKGLLNIKLEVLSHIYLLVYTIQVNSTFRARWLASSEVISQVLFTSEQPKENKMAFVGILSQIKLLFGR